MNDSIRLVGSTSVRKLDVNDQIIMSQVESFLDEGYSWDKVCLGLSTLGFKNSYGSPFVPKAVEKAFTNWIRLQDLIDEKRANKPKLEIELSRDDESTLVKVELLEFLEKHRRNPRRTTVEEKRLYNAMNYWIYINGAKDPTFVKTFNELRSKFQNKMTLKPSTFKTPEPPKILNKTQKREQKKLILLGFLQENRRNPSRSVPSEVKLFHTMVSLIYPSSNQYDADFSVKYQTLKASFKPAAWQKTDVAKTLQPELGTEGLNIQKLKDLRMQLKSLGKSDTQILNFLIEEEES